MKLGNLSEKQMLRKFRKEAMIYGIPVKTTHSKQSNTMFAADGNETMSKTTIKPSRKNMCDRFIIAPDSRYKQFFNIVIIFLSLISTITAAYFACFGFVKDPIFIALELMMESCFLLDIILNFLLQYKDDEDFKPVKDLKKIAIRYLKRFFIIDFLATVPLRYMMLSDEPDTLQLFYLLKLLRLPKLQSVMDTKNFQDMIKSVFRRRLQSVIRNENKQKESNVDNNKIMLQIKIMYAFRVLRLIVTILILSYFLGTLWFIFSKRTTATPEDYTFFNEYDLADREDSENLIIVVYFAFTTLSTVGFGDYNPKSELERIITTFILLIGVACFSYIMGQFIEILMNFQTVTADNEDSENLSKWLGLLAHFNKNRPLSKEMTKRFEQYFDYYWQHDKNYAIQSDEDMRFMKELPKHIRRDIYKDFLFKDFLYLFKTHFKLVREDSSGKMERAFWTWDDNAY